MSTHRHKGKWRYDFWLNKIRYTKWGYSTKQEARIAETEARKKLKRINTGFISLCEKRLEDLELKRSGSHFKEIKKFIEKLIPLWGAKKEITREDIEKFLQGEARIKPTKANRSLKYVNALFNFGVRRELIRENPARFIERYPSTPKTKYTPPIEDVAKVLNLATEEQRLYLIVVINTMARIREINKLKWEDIRGDYLILRTRKSRDSNLKERRIPINDSLREAIERIPNLGEYVFINPKTKTAYDYRDKFLDNLCTKAKVRRFTYHALRHLGASRLNKGGVPLTDIQKLLGHSRATTTDIYLHSISSSLAEATKKLEVPQ
jgi:integrase